jgi:hypothetical protein
MAHHRKMEGSLGIENLNLFAMLRLRLTVSEPSLEQEEESLSSEPQEVLATVSCVCEVYTGPKEAMTSRRYLMYALKGDISRGEEVDWKIAFLQSH